MSSVTREYEVHLWNDEQWERWPGARYANFAEAEARALKLIDARTPHARVIEVETTVSHKIVARPSYLGVTDEEIVRNLAHRNEIDR